MIVAGRPPTLLFGVPIDDLTMNDCLDVIEDLVHDGRAHGRTHQIATVNVDFLVNAVENEKLHALLQSTSLNLADGLPLVWSSRLLGLPVRERVAGADLVPLLAAESERRGWSVHFFGSAPDVVERALADLRQRYPGARLSGESGPIISDPTLVDDAVLDGIAERQVDILCVALGNPKQEWFISSNLERLGCSVAIGIGGSLDMLVGDRKRAPKWAQDIGVEWIIRAAQEPARLGPRYAHDVVVFGPRMARYTKDLRQAGNGHLSIESRPDGITIKVADDDIDVSQAVRGWMDNADGALSLQLGSRALSPVALARASGLIRFAQTFGRQITSSPVAGPLRSQLDRLGLVTWFDTLAENAAT